MLYVEPNRKRDPDNIVAGGTKLLLDSLVGAGVLRGDGWSDNLGFIGYWAYRASREGCLVHWGEEILTKQAMEALLEKELENSGKNENGNRPGIARDGSGRAANSSRRGRRGAQSHRQLSGK
jgi:hypothetical protein